MHTAGVHIQVRSHLYALLMLSGTDKINDIKSTYLPDADI